MTDKEIQELLLAHYKKHYILLPVDQGLWVAKGYCLENKICFGLCSSIVALCKISYFKSDSVFGLEVRPLPVWIRIYKRGDYWGNIPFACETVQEIRSALRLRIDILCKILNLPLNCCFYDEEGV